MIAAAKPMFLPPRSEVLVAALSALMLVFPFSALADVVTAPNASAAPANQLVVSGNACGPTALLNAFRTGGDSWRRAIEGLSGDTDKARIYTIIREYGMRPSRHLPGKSRWSRKGVNIADLCDIANEMTTGKFLPQVSHEVLFRTGKESREQLLKRIHSRLETSLEKGFPPLVSLRRYTLRKQDGKPPEWIVLDAHFVTLIEIPAKLEKGASSFPVTYIDPWGGKRTQGSIALPDQPLLANDTASSPCAVAVFPASSVGKKLIKPGEPNALAVAALLGRW